MNDTNYKIRIRIGETEIEAEGDKEFVREVLSEFREKGTTMLSPDALKPTTEKKKVAKILKEKEEKAPSKKIPSRAPKFLLERRAMIDKFMTESIPEEPPYRAAIQGAGDLEHQCAYVLLLFREKYEIMGLSASELGKILVKRLSISTTSDTISKKLSKWATHIDTVKHPRHAALKLYQLTAGGTEDIRHSLEVDSGRFQPKSVEDIMKE